MQYPLYTLVYFYHIILIVFYYQSLQLPYQQNHDDIENLGIFHVIWRQCVAFHHSDLYQVCSHVVDETPTFGWLVCRNWYEKQKLLSLLSLALFWCIFCRFIHWRLLFTHVTCFIVFQWNYTMCSTTSNDVINVKPNWGRCLFMFLICFLVRKIDIWTLGKTPQ